ncbi:MAG TPA: hypothetical protein VLB86_09500 [Gaiellaceae bacterium]|nr:hypothetical protein [Gaiellaceae bacterium]
MTVAYASADTLPYLCGLYVCACGRTATSHGLAAGVLPRGWLLLSRNGDDVHVCPRCAPGTAGAGWAQSGR